MTPAEMRAASTHQHIAEISPVPRRQGAREIVQRMLWPMTIVSAVISGYREEMDHMLAADPIYLGPGK